MKAKEKMIRIIIVLAAGICLFPAIHGRFAFARSRPSAHETAPDFSLKTLAGKNVRLSDLKGRVVLVNFFASWCPPCRMEIPDFEKTYLSYKDRGFAVIGIALDDVSPSFIEKMKMTYPVAMANDNVISDYGNVSSIPVSFLVGKDGRIIKKIMGMYFENSMKSDVENALKGKN
ncbi:TlpA family protein disulfide reductase [Oryzomonas japonica]|uniref:TlpA family protein disulfide reductase n=1 Tax=Oryzomonas japonica TaxID=2603858 RepID=A0A7J4ZLP8_9BACT|nr:TlpA disulfide reductase family protein [Oryzomonas japonica]KAB0663412.1 TlpA family protein disulfide reductase [Oryzomonas japonica]